MVNICKNINLNHIIEGWYCNLKRTVKFIIGLIGGILGLLLSSTKANIT